MSNGISTEQARENARDRFAGRLTDILNFGALNLAVAVGYRLGLFEAMDALDAPAPAAVIAKKAGLSQRYVREWLAAMACGKVVELSTDSAGAEYFRLPRAHGDLLCKRAGSANMGVYTREVPLLTQCAMEPVVEGFKTGKGVPHDRYPEFQAYMGELADGKHRRTLVETFLPTVDDGRMVARLRRGIRVCDLGCGEGTAALLMAEAFPESRFTGMDISGSAIKQARKSAAKQGIGNVEFLQLDAAELSANAALSETFDYVTAFDSIHDQTRPEAALAGVYHILRQGGCFSMIDIAAGSKTAENLDHPMGPFLYTVSLMHCMPMGLHDNGAGLGMMWGRQRAVEMLNAAGFNHVQAREIPGDGFNLHFFCCKPYLMAAGG